MVLVREVSIFILSGLLQSALVDAVRQTGESGERNLLSKRHKPLYPDFINSQYTQQFEVKEDNLHGLSWFKSYKFKLEEYEHGKQEFDMKQKVPMIVKPEVLTMKGRMQVQIGDQEYELVKPHFTGTNPFGHYSWRVVPKGEPDKVLFTIQKRKWNDCKHFYMLGCKAVWKIYEGQRGDKSSLIYYGTGDADDQDEPDFKFYHNKDEYKDNKKNWVAKIEHKKHDSSDGEDKFKVKVAPGEDTALILVSVACIDYVADAKRAPED